MRIKLALFAAAALLALSLLQGEVAHAATITVNTTDDELNSDGDCSLREALRAANTDAAVDACIAGSGADTILLAAGIYTLSIPGTNEDTASTGDLDIADDLTLTGAGALTTVIDGNHIDRVIEVANSVTAHVSGVTIRNGESVSFAFNGGGIANFGDLTLTDSIVTGNSVVDLGGGILNVGTLTMTNVTVEDNTAGMNVGGIANVGNAMLTGVTVSDNEAVGFVGGILNEGSLTLDSSTVSGNSALLAGGIFNAANFSGSTQLKIVNSTIRGNSAGAAGGGIFNIESPVTITNSTVSGNNGGNQGGGIYNEMGMVTLLNSTISGNIASEGGGIYIAGAALFTNTTLKNTIVANSTGADCGGSPITSEGNNIDSDGTCGLTDPSDLVNTDPLLGPLADNGGPTQTHALLAGSPAIDAGSDDCPPPATDQRGVARPQSAACDIGAFESTPPDVDSDTDGDGMPDQYDQCPSEPGDLFFLGCPDSDGDFMPDPLDQCPNQSGELIFRGCPDSDGDFTPDTLDQCPNQSGELIFGGCPDSDGDFTPDTLDQCPNQSGELIFGGCPDSDGDFMPDQYDQCPNDPGLAFFGGCPNGDDSALDSDFDGIPDQFDICPLEPGQEIFGGCPDSDGDFMPDPLDQCPNQSGEPLFGGCPDSDGDFMPDTLDQCPNQSGEPLFRGCPDSDGDGFPDLIDNCPNDPNPDQADTDSDGKGDACDLDDDNDGVANEIDLCSFTALGSPVDGEGCSDAQVDGDGDGVCDSSAPSAGPSGCTGSDSCPLAPTGDFDADGDGCRDTLPGFVAFVSGLEDVPESVQKALLRRAADISHVLCVDGNTGVAVKKSQALLNYISAQTGKKMSGNTAAILTDYVLNLITQVQAGQEVCSSP